MIPKIVLIEDDLILAENTKTILELNQFECTVAHQGQLGVELVQSFKPDLVVCDIMLDEVDGLLQDRRQATGEEGEGSRCGSGQAA